MAHDGPRWPTIGVNSHSPYSINTSDRKEKEERAWVLSKVLGPLADV